MNIGIIGGGAWGSALAISSAHSGNNVVVWSFDGECKVFDGVAVPENMRIETEMSFLRDSDAWLVVTPAAFFEETMIKASGYYNNQPVIICTKGADAKTGRFMSEILTSVLPGCEHYGVLSGPQFAAEVASGLPTGSTLAGDDVVYSVGSVALSSLYLHRSSDIVGTQLCGIGKNAVALIAGYNSIAASGENERALLFTRAWGEVISVGLAMGASVETFCDLCGVGDLFLSATSATSRNFSGGMSIAMGTPPQGTVEGIFALRGLIGRGRVLGVATPVLCEMQTKLKL